MNKIVAVALCVFLAGCSVDQATLEQDAQAALEAAKTAAAKNPKVVTSIVQKGAILGLQKWAKNHKSAESIAAQAIHEIIGTNYAAYLKGDDLNVDAAAFTALKASLGSKLPPGSEDLVMVLQGLLDLQVSVPDARTYLDAESLIILQAAVKGIDNACLACLVVPKPPSVLAPTAPITPAK